MFVKRTHIAISWQSAAAKAGMSKGQHKLNIKKLPMVVIAKPISGEGGTPTHNSQNVQNSRVKVAWQDFHRGNRSHVLAFTTPCTVKKNIRRHCHYSCIR